MNTDMVYVPTEGDYVTVEPSRLGQFPGVWQVFEAQNRYDGMKATLVQPGWDTDLGSLTVPAYLLSQYTGKDYQ